MKRGFNERLHLSVKFVNMSVIIRMLRADTEKGLKRDKYREYRLFIREE